MNDYDPFLQRLEAEDRIRHQRVRRVILEEAGVSQLAEFDAAMRDVRSGVAQARNIWHSISPAQRRALTAASEHGGRLTREGREYRHRDRHQPYRPIHVAILRPLCERNLMAWDGGAFDPEGAAVITEHGLFVLKHGEGK